MASLAQPIWLVEQAQVFNFSPTWANLIWLPGLVVGFTVHELGHALVAYWLGDRGGLTRDRLTLNPLKHISWLGLAAFVLLGFGWAKPVQIRPGALKYTNLGALLVSLAGVTANALLALVFAGVVFAIGLLGTLIARQTGLDPQRLAGVITAQPFTPLNALVAALTSGVVNVNLALAIFNLLPIPGLDGFRAIYSLGGLIVRHKLTDQERRRARAEMLFDEGVYYARRERPALAVRSWRQALELDPQFYSALYNLGLAYWQAGRRDWALGALGRARAAAAYEGEKQQVDALLAQMGWDSQTPPPAMAVSELPELPAAAAPPGPDKPKLVSLALGAAAGLAAYTGLMTLLALLAAGLRL